MIVLFKAVLLAALMVLAYLALFQFRGRWLPQALGIAFGVLLATFIIMPELATKAANLVGIGRGADLVFYLSHALGAYLAIRIFQRQVRLEGQVTELVRALSHLGARVPDGAPTGDGTRRRIFSTHPAHCVEESHRESGSA